MKRILSIAFGALGALAIAATAVPSERHWVTNPASGASLGVEVAYPVTTREGRLPALVLVPGGRGDSSGFLKERPGGSDAERLTSQGFAVIVFDPDGRGASSGSEDDNGSVQQDGLAAVIRFAASLPHVDASRLGLVSYSYGVTMAAGALARHPELPVLFFIDWEGPANRDDTGGCNADNLGHLKGHPCDDESFWSEREASTFMASINVPYQRLQSRIDHVQPDADHAILLMAQATAEAFGGQGRSPWTRLNDLPPNRVYTTDNPPPLPGKDVNLQALVGEIARELLELFAPRTGSGG